MKKLTYLLTFLLILGAYSCSKDKKMQRQIEKDVTKGTWKITFFEEDGNNETNHFSGYNFTFKDDGTLNANNGSNNYNGTWSLSNSSSNDDSQSDLDFNINFNLSNDFEDLNDDWEIISNSSSKIELKDVSGGNGGTDYLTFEKN